MSMSRKEFSLVAESFRRTLPKRLGDYDGVEYGQWRRSVKDMTLMFKRIYPRFNEYRFLTACGLELPDHLIKR